MPTHSAHTDGAVESAGGEIVARDQDEERRDEADDSLAISEVVMRSEPRGMESPAASTSGSFVVGETGKYRLIKLLGRGGMADVYLALMCGFGGLSKVVVVKCLREEIADDEAFRAMFLEEARLAAKLSHPNIVDTYEVDEQDGAYFIAMEYLEGEALSDIMKAWHDAGALDAPTSACIVSDVLRALHSAHELADFDGTALHIVHRDVSPHNIFITSAGEVKLVDFGIAKAEKRSTQTEVGVVKGKMMYMAPEQALGTANDRRADLFPAGIILWELLTGKRLMAGDEDSSTLHKLLNLPIPRVSSVDPSVDPRLDDIVARALERDCDLRYATAREMADELDAYLVGHASKDIGDLMEAHFGQGLKVRRLEISDLISAALAGRPITNAKGEPLVARRGTGSGAGRSGSGSGRGHARDGLVDEDPTRLDQTPRPVFPGADLLVPHAGKRRVATALAFVGVAVLAWTGARLTQHPPASSAGVTTTSVRVAPTVEPVLSLTTPHADSVPPAPTAPSTTPAVPTIAPKATATAVRPRKPTGEAAPATSSPTASDPAAMGYVTIDTSPWTRVVIDGQVRGTTPLVRAPVPAGTHTVLLENPEQGISRVVQIQVSAGETTMRRIPVN